MRWDGWKSAGSFSPLFLFLVISWRAPWWRWWWWWNQRINSSLSSVCDTGCCCWGHYTMAWAHYLVGGGGRICGTGLYIYSWLVIRHRSDGAETLWWWQRRRARTSSSSSTRPQETRAAALCVCVSIDYSSSSWARYGSYTRRRRRRRQSLLFTQTRPCFLIDFYPLLLFFQGFLIFRPQDDNVRAVGSTTTLLFSSPIAGFFNETASASQ